MKKKKLTKAQQKAVDAILGEWYKIGWNADPRRMTPKTALGLLHALAAVANLTWQNDIRTGRVPPEDVSPAEGFLLLAYFVEHACKTAKLSGVKTGDLIDRYHKKNVREIDAIERTFREALDKVAPGHFTMEDGHGDE